MNNLLCEPPSSWPYSVKSYQECVASYLQLEWLRCKQDPWYFIKSYPLTRDQLDQRNPFKHFPDLQYLAHLTDLYLTERAVVVAKSRRTIATWHAVAFNLWDCLFWDGRKCGFQNENQLKANEMIAMAVQMYESLPAWMRQRSPMKATASRIQFTARRSDIIAVPEGPDVLRMHTFSRITSDEVGQQKHCPETYKAAKQTITGRSVELSGQLIWIGTAKDAWFEHLVNDKLETEDAPKPLWSKQLFPESRPVCDCALAEQAKPDHGCKRYGMDVVRQASSGYICVWLHYTADPEKRSETWLAFARKGIPPEDWAQEMEIDFRAKSGKKALAVFVRFRKKIVVPTFDVPKWWPRWSSHDYGLTKPYSCHFYTMGPDGCVYAYWEHYRPGPLHTHLEDIKAQPDFPVLKDKILDRTCWTAWQQSSNTIEGQTMHMVRSIAQMHSDAGVDCVPATNPQDRVKIEAFLAVWNEEKLLAGEEPKFKIMECCGDLIRELPGIRWVTPTYNAKAAGEAAEKLVDSDNHAFDECSYSLLHITSPGNEPVKPRQLTDADVQRELRIEISMGAYIAAEAEADDGGGSSEVFDDGLD